MTHNQNDAADQERMMIEDEENIVLKKAKKMEKHFEVLINGRRAKILNFRFKPYKDKYESGENLEIVSKVKLPLFPDDLATFEMRKDSRVFAVTGRFKSASICPGNYIWTYTIIEKVEKLIAEPSQEHEVSNLVTNVKHKR